MQGVDKTTASFEGQYTRSWLILALFIPLLACSFAAMGWTQTPIWITIPICLFGVLLPLSMIGRTFRLQQTWQIKVDLQQGKFIYENACRTLFDGPLGTRITGECPLTGVRGGRVFGGGPRDSHILKIDTAEGSIVVECGDQGLLTATLGTVKDAAGLPLSSRDCLPYSSIGTRPKELVHAAILLAIIAAVAAVVYYMQPLLQAF